MNKKSVSNEMLLSMAVAGLLAGSIGTSCGKEEPNAPAPAMQNKSAAPAANPGGAVAMVLEKHACKSMNSCKSKGGCKTGDAGCAGKNSCKTKGGCATVDKHSCSGQNECKGLGGCKSGDAGCAGKNSCKAKGGCSVPVEH